MYTISFGRVTAGGQPISAYGLIDNRDGKPLGTFNNFNDGSGHWDIAPWQGADPLIIVCNPTLKAQGIGFNLSHLPAGVTFDAATGELNIDLPFA